MVTEMGDEAGRVSALRGYGVLDTPNEPEFDSIVREAARALDAPIALISLIDETRQWFKAAYGLQPVETPRSISFCTHAIRGPEVMVVKDATCDARFSANPYVTGDPNIRFYAGAPLKTPEGHRIGTLCVIGPKAREGLTGSQQEALEALARETVSAFETKKRQRQSATRPPMTQ